MLDKPCFAICGREEELKLGVFMVDGGTCLVEGNYRAIVQQGETYIVYNRQGEHYCWIRTVIVSCDK